MILKKESVFGNDKRDNTKRIRSSPTAKTRYAKLTDYMNRKFQAEREIKKYRGGLHKTELKSPTEK